MVLSAHKSKNFCFSSLFLNAVNFDGLACTCSLVRASDTVNEMIISKIV